MPTTAVGTRPRQAMNLRPCDYRRRAGRDLSGAASALVSEEMLMHHQTSVSTLMVFVVLGVLYVAAPSG